MSDMSDTPRPEPKGWTFWQGTLVFFLSAATLGTAGPAGFSVYRTSRDFALPYLGHEAWILPVALEAVFMVLFGWGIVLAWRKVADVPVRIAGSAAITALSFAVQIDAAHGSFAGILVRVAIVASFFVAGFTMKATFMRLRGGKVRGDHVTFGEFLASPVRAAGLWRWKSAWAEPSAKTARQRYMVLLYVIALAQSGLAQRDERDGRTRRTSLGWRRRLPVTLRYELSTGLLPPVITAGGDGWQEAAQEHVGRQLALLGSAHGQGTAEVIQQGTAEAPAQGTGEGTPRVTPKGIREGSDWPETKDINKAVLMRRVRAACERWEKSHDGRHLPATQLGTELRVRMSRDTATALLRQAYGTSDRQHAGART